MLSRVESEESIPGDCAVVLSEPKADADSIRCGIVLEGSVPTSSGACTLFIDSLGVDSGQPLWREGTVATGAAGAESVNHRS